ncbi:hypothetical protein [Dactylosporangium salmoneum]|uniref:Uncharacterized protein n=1 Tax=Dactylosporangium salmoneum TaxID=53361 RepID=A0ABN3G5B8_9ACTN
MTHRLPQPPIDREHLAALHEMLRRQARTAPPAADPLTRELQQNIADGVRGRDLLSIAVYREHLTAHAEAMTDKLQRLRHDLDEHPRPGRDE